MKIKHKLTISFSVIITLIIIVFGYVILYFSTQYRKNEFYNRLKQRVDITEKIFLEREHFTEEAYNKIHEQFLNKLPEETEEVLPLTDSFRSTLKYTYPEEFIVSLLENGEAYFQEEERQVAGRIFTVDNARYLVLLTAVDHIGIRMMDHLQTIIVIVLAVCILVISLASFIVSSQVLAPISKKIQKANSISARNLHERLTDYDPDDEMGELAIAFNNLLDRVGEAFETQKLFVDNASHEIRNPLTAIMGESEYALEKTRSQQEYIESFKTVAHEAERLNALVNELLQLSTINYKRVKFDQTVIDIRELILQARQKLDSLHPQNNVKLNLDGQPGGWIVKGNAHLLQTAFFNLLDNASKFSFFKEVRVSMTFKKPGMVVVTIQDQGLGIPPDDLGKIRHPFHRASNVRHIEGTGVGIPLTAKIVELHNGTLEVESTLHVGTTVLVTLPLAD